MPFFAYKGRKGGGVLAEGVLEGADPGAIADQLLAIGVTPVQITATTQAAADNGPKITLWEKLTEAKVTPMDVQLFSRQINTLLRAGVPIMRGLSGLQESAISKPFGRVIGDLRDSLDSGRELSAAMRRHPEIFSNFYLSMVRVGEMTGRMDEVFLRLFDHLEFDRDMRDRVKSALRYPTFVVFAMVIAMVIVNVFVIPSFAKVFESFRTELPLMTRILIGSSNFTRDYWGGLLGAVFAAGFGWNRFLKTAHGRLMWDRAKLHLPVAGKIMMKATMSRFARSFALASKSGVPIVQALTVVSETVENAYLSQQVDRMRDGVERGESILRTAAATGVFTPVVLQMIAVGEESGSLDDLMDEIALMYEREVEYELKTLSAQIEPILLIFMGGLILVLALGIFLPIWELGKVSLRK